MLHFTWHLLGELFKLFLVPYIDVFNYGVGSTCTYVKTFYGNAHSSQLEQARGCMSYVRCRE
jgi:hypothetical protein